MLLYDAAEAERGHPITASPTAGGEVRAWQLSREQLEQEVDGCSTELSGPLPQRA
jgi:hypothetical protein